MNYEQEYDLMIGETTLRVGYNEIKPEPENNINSGYEICSVKMISSPQLDYWKIKFDHFSKYDGYNKLISIADISSKMWSERYDEIEIKELYIDDFSEGRIFPTEEVLNAVYTLMMAANNSIEKIEESMNLIYEYVDSVSSSELVSISDIDKIESELTNALL